MSMSNVESIDAGDVRRVAKYNKVNLTTDQVIRILDDYPSEQRKDPTATWDLVVEDQIHNIANVPVRPKKKRKDTINVSYYRYHTYIYRLRPRCRNIEVYRDGGWHCGVICESRRAGLDWLSASPDPTHPCIKLSYEDAMLEMI